MYTITSTPPLIQLHNIILVALTYLINLKFNMKCAIHNDLLRVFHINDFLFIINIYKYVKIIVHFTI